MLGRQDETIAGRIDLDHPSGDHGAEPLAHVTLV
jgi:hypothetical protein